ncbi:MAG: type pilus assembly protein PilA [Solirubrobacterales bacterium]|jgi:type IV pilus assembly protein PilA|nr:type pilus assembly protein PilA [Solirubrobacterales bacterium]
MLLQNLRAKIGARLNGDKEAGFTLIELLVVMLILGILAAIALPAFFNQKDKAGDAKAKEYAHSAQVAMETCATEDPNGSYAGCTDIDLIAIEPTLNSADGLTVMGPGEAAAPTATAYQIRVDGTSGWFAIQNSAGTMTYPCETPGEGGCPAGVGGWGG